VDKKLLKSISYFVGVSQCCADSLRLRPVFSDISKIKHIYNGTPIIEDTASIQHPVSLRERLEIEKKPLCLMLATYELRKGHPFIFEVFKTVNSVEKDAQLVICGDGTIKEKEIVDNLRKKIAADSNIHLLEFIPNGRNLISQADILVVPSQEWESFGWTVIEAMTRKVPVVATNAGGLAEVVGPNGIAGFSIDPADVKTFSEAIINLLQDPNLSKKISNEAYNRVVEHFNVQRMAKEYSELIRSDI
jgi:glycosyltransferase involved in cell wall biosynthesis